MIALIAFNTAESIEDRDPWRDLYGYDEDDDWNGDDVVDKDDERDARTAARVLSGVAAVGVGVGVVGTVLLLKRLAKRKVYSPEIRELRERRRQLLYGLRYGANVAPNQVQLSLGGSF